MIETVSYSYSDLTPILDEVRKKSATLWEQINTLNKWRIHSPKTPSAMDETLPELASKERLYWQSSRKFKKEIVPLEEAVNENEKLMQNYRTETDKRNNILSRMRQLKWIMKARYESDAKNRLAWTNIVKNAIKEYKQLSKEAYKFIPLINK